MKNFWQKYRKIIIIFIFWWIAINIFALLVAHRFNFEHDTAYIWMGDGWWPNPPKSFVNLHIRWDSQFYIDIAENGYSCPPKTLCNSVFFPLYPFLIKGLGILPGIDYYLAAFLISNLSLFGAVIVFYNLVLLKYSSKIAQRAVWFLLIFPTSFFFAAIYAESLFLFLSLLCFYFTFKSKWRTAGLIGFLASMTRITGFLLFFPMLWEFFRKNRKLSLGASPPKFSFFARPNFSETWAGGKFWRASWLGLTLLGPIGFFTYHWKKFGDFFLFFRTEKLWGRTFFTLDQNNFKMLTSPAKVNLFLDLLILFFVLISIIFIWRKLRKSYALYMGLSLIAPLSTGTLMSINRYVLILFPFYILMALWSEKNSCFEKIYPLVSILIFSLYIILFVNNYWAG